MTNPNNTRTASFNYVVDSIDIIQCIPEDEVTWNAGDGKDGEGNNYYISIEICESGNFLNNQAKAIELIVYLIKKYNFGINNIKKHQDFSDKYCPRLIIPYWNQFLEEIQFEFDKTYN